MICAGCCCTQGLCAPLLAERRVFRCIPKHLDFFHNADSRAASPPHVQGIHCLSALLDDRREKCILCEAFPSSRPLSPFPLATTLSSRVRSGRSASTCHDAAHRTEGHVLLPRCVLGARIAKQLAKEEEEDEELSLRRTLDAGDDHDAKSGPARSSWGLLCMIPGTHKKTSGIAPLGSNSRLLELKGLIPDRRAKHVTAMSKNALLNHNNVTLTGIRKMQEGAGCHERMQQDGKQGELSVSWDTDLASETTVANRYSPELEK
ncbi:hypothetical protein CB1_002263008 [Camelus ferus]|nr:hypothetical protein CB1_002263008 [Camelus ferus]